MPDAIKQRSLHYLYGQLRKARIAMGQAEDKPNSTNEIANLQNKIEMLEWIIGVVIKEDDEDGCPGKAD